LKVRTPADPRSGYLLQSETEVNAAAIVQLYAIDISLTRRQICQVLLHADAGNVSWSEFN